jgi:Bacterial regulatory proteins, tetR family
MVGPFYPQLRKCRVRPASYAWCQYRTFAAYDVVTSMSRSSPSWSTARQSFRTKNRMGSNEAISKARGGGLREAIVDAAQRLFLERAFGAVSMDDLAAAAGVARRTLYNQFASKEEIFREMLLRVSAQLETAFPSGIGLCYQVRKKPISPGIPPGYSRT